MTVGFRSRLLLASTLLAVSPELGFTAGQVGNGTSGSCTTAALDTALQGGGTVTFDCGPAPHAIVLGHVISLSDDTEIDGGGLITLSGGNARPILQVSNGVTATIDDITLALGFGPFGAIENFGTLTVADSRIEDCTSTAGGGAISNYGILNVVEGTIITGNQAELDGGGITNDGGTVTITDSEISDNETAVAVGNEGGGIYSNAELSISSSTIADNSAVLGGGIFSSGSLVLLDSTVQGNDISDIVGANYGAGVAVEGGTATLAGTSFIDNDAASNSRGGGVFVQDEAVATISDATFTENYAETGGGLYNVGDTTIKRSTFFANAAYYIAAIVSGIENVAPVIRLENVTVSGNTPSGPAGTAVYLSYGTSELQFVTIASNVTGIGALSIVNAGNHSITSSIVAGNSPSDCYASVDPFSDGFNIASDVSCNFPELTDQNPVDPELGPLVDNGGFTLTHRPGPNSPAIDQGQCDVDVDTDQRGIDRPQGLGCDVGAVEVEPTTTTTSTSSTTVEPPTTTTTLGGTTTTTLAGGVCGDPVALVGPVARAIASAVNASDALAVLNAAVGLFECELCVCDVDSSGSIAASDALAVLRNAVGLGPELDCPACG